MKSRSKFNPLSLTTLGAAILVFAAGFIGASANAGAGPYLPPGSAGDYTADGVLGQINFSEVVPNFRDSRGVSNSFTGLGDVAIDKSVSPNRVYAVDYDNNRVLGWTSIAAFAAHNGANIALGQPNVNTGRCNYGGVPTASTLCGPTSVAVDGAGRVYVGDTGNNRVLEYNSPFATNLVADDVFGQFGSFETKDCNSGFSITSDSLCAPTGVGVDKTNNLYVADRDNSRVLEYHTPETISATVGSGDTTADIVFGQGNDFTRGFCNFTDPNNQTLCKPNGVAADSSNNVYIADTGNNRVLGYITPLVSGTGADRVFGQINNFGFTGCNIDGGILNATSLCAPMDVATDSANNLYVADTKNNRVLEYNNPIPTNTTADKVFGQGDVFTTNACNLGGISAKSLCLPAGVSVDTGDSMYAADAGNNRELSYTTPLSTDTTADGVLSQVLLTTNAPNNVDTLGIDTGFNNGGVAIDKSVVPNRVYVADYGNNRVLAWNNISAFTTHAAANLVIGQPTNFTSIPNNGGLAANRLSLPIAVAVDAAGNLYVADSGNNRVLEFNTPFVSGGTADKVFGQLGNFTTNTCNNGGITADSLCGPLGVAIDSAGNVFISDSQNNRALEYNTPLTTNTTADKVFGQANFLSGLCNRGAGPTTTALCNPWGIALDSSNNVYIADNSNNRVLEYLSPGVGATRVFGQLNIFTTNSPNQGGLSAKSLSAPQGVAVDSLGNVYVVDKSNNRGLKFNTPGDTTADKVFGQGGVFNQGGCLNFNPDPASPNTLCVPDGIATDSSNNVYIVDSENFRVLQFLAP